MKKLVLVNEKDEQIGLETKEKCHQGKGLLHRAFAIFVFNDKDELLIQQRSKFKKLWPLSWDNSCCSHPLGGESYEGAGEKRLQEELGFTCLLKLVDKFQYQAPYRNIGSENEICAILIGKYNGEVSSNPEEVAAFNWTGMAALKADIAQNPDKYTPWLKIALKKHFS